MRRWIRRHGGRLTTVVIVGLLVAASIATTAVVTGRHPKIVPASSPQPYRIAIIGDSFSSGSSNGVVWPSLVAMGSSLSISNVAFPGAGYVGSAGESASFSAQVDKALASKPDMIVVFGGANDVYNSTDLVAQAAIDLFTEIARRAPTTRLLVLGPIWHEDPAPDNFDKLNAAIASSASVTNSPYLPLIQEKWLVGDGLIQPDGFTPTDEGQSVLARRLGPVLKGRVQLRDGGETP